MIGNGCRILTIVWKLIFYFFRRVIVNNILEKLVNFWLIICWQLQSESSALSVWIGEIVLHFTFSVSEESILKCSSKNWLVISSPMILFGLVIGHAQPLEATVVNFNQCKTALVLIALKSKDNTLELSWIVSIPHLVDSLKSKVEIVLLTH